MGHMIHPVSYRLAYTHACPNVWHVRSPVLYNLLFTRFAIIISYLNKLFTTRMFREFLLLSEIRSIFRFRQYNIHVSFYSTFVYEFLHKIIRPSDRKSKLYKRFKLRVLKLFCRGILQIYFMYHIFKLLTLTISKDCSFILGYPVQLSFICVPQEALSANGWTDFICYKLKKRNTFSHTMTQVLPILKDMLHQEVLSGFKISCSGRLSRRGRSVTHIRNKGRTPFSTITAFISYSYRHVILKNSLCGIKVWLFFQQNPFRLKLVRLRSINFSYPFVHYS